MFAAFPSPVLSVAADVVRDLDEFEALPGLWTLFTKCKGSLKDGRRLENISWRLWYREMTAVSLERRKCRLIYESEKAAIEGGISEENAYRPPTPEEALQGATDPESLYLSSSRTPDFLIPTLRSRLSVTSTLARRRCSTSRNTRHHRAGVGRIICDLLPNSLPPEMLRDQPSRQPTSAVPPQFTTTTVQEPSDINCDPSVVNDAKISSLPTPSAEEHDIPPTLPPVTSPTEVLPRCQTSCVASNLTPVQLSRAQDPLIPGVPAFTILDASDPPAPVISEPNLVHACPGSSPGDPDISLAPTTASPNGLTLPPPRLIVVNPTPNPTPHPTPPATPVLQNTSPQLAGNLVIPSGNQHLLQPPVFHVVPVQQNKLGCRCKRRSVVQNDNLIVEVTLNHEQLLANIEPPRIPGEDVQVLVPPSPTLTDEAIMPPQSATLNPDFLDQTQLHHPLTVSTVVEPVTKKPSALMLVPSSPSVVAHIFGEPAYMSKITNTTKSPTSPTEGNTNESIKESPDVASPTAESEKPRASSRPGPVRRQNSVGVKASSSGPKKLPRTHSTGNVVTLNNAAGTHTRNPSRSRSRDGQGPGLGLGTGALVMTRAASTGPAVRARAKAVGGSKGITTRLGTRKTVGRSTERSKSKEKEKDVEDVHEAGSLKRPTFNIGSNSDEGSGVGSKSIGSGSEVSRAPGAVRVNGDIAQSKIQEESVGDEEDNEVRQKPAMAQEGLDKTLGTQALLEAFLPQQQKRIVVASSDDEEDFETDDGSWSSEDLSGDEVELAKSDGSNATKHKPQPQFQQYRPPAVQAQVDDAARLKQLPTNPLPPPAHHNDKRPHFGRLSRRQVLLNQTKAHTQSIEQAALEAQRQRDMFTKLPTSENIARTRSVGLLTQLMNPDPHIFHPNHPYRRGFSSSEVRGQHQPGQGQFRLPDGLAITNVQNPTRPNPNQAQQAPPESRPQDTVPAKAVPPRVASPVAISPPAKNAHPHATVSPVTTLSGTRRSSSTHQPPRQYAAPSFRTNKVSAAMPVASQVQVGSLRPNSGGKTGELMSQPGLNRPPVGSRLQMNGMNGRPAGGYRPRGRPEDAELEEESATEEESTIQVSKSVAQEKLRVLAERRGIRPNRRVSTDDAKPQPLPAWAEHPAQQQQQPHTRPPGPVRMHTTPTPIPQALTHPYNLPLTALPTTPRTTRRHMLQTEMSESLRRNLLWERQVSKNNILGFRRTASSGCGPRGNVLNGVKPLATNDPVPAPPNMVHLTAKGSKLNNNNPVPNEAGNPAQESSKAFARNRSWAGEEDDYHRKGW